MPRAASQSSTARSRPALAQPGLEQRALGGERLERLGDELEDRRIDEHDRAQRAVVAKQDVEDDQRAEPLPHGDGPRRLGGAQQGGEGPRPCSATVVAA